MIKSGDLFEFMDWRIKSCDSSHNFYDETLDYWFSVGTNFFICLAHVKNIEWNDQYDHSLFFTDGDYLFHTRVDVCGISEPLAVNGTCYVQALSQ